MGGHDSQISPIPPDRYGDRFIKFISGITMSRERAEKERLSQRMEESGIPNPNSSDVGGTIDDPSLGGVNLQRDPANPAGTERVMEKARREAERSKKLGASEVGVPDRSISSVRSGEQSPAEASTLPVIGEAAENASTASRTPSRITPTPSHEDVGARRQHAPDLGNANMPSDSVGEIPPPTPPKTDGGVRKSNEQSLKRESWGGGPPPTPPKDDRRGRFVDKDLPLPPVATHVFSASPSRMVDEEMEKARAKAQV